MTHISIVLSERNANGASADVATTVSEAAPAKASKGKTAGKAGAKKKSVAKKAAK